MHSMDDRPRRTCQRYDTPYQAHELTFSCYHRHPFLTGGRVRGFLRDAIIRAISKHDFELWAYVFMPEHVHLIIWPRREDYSVSRILQSIKQPVARREFDHLRREDPAALASFATGQRHTRHRFWLDGGGYDRNVTAPATLMRMVKYIHDNPVRRELVESPEEWVWSSARAWMEGGAGPVPLTLDSFPWV